MPAEILLERLERVRKSGTGWYARCPAHQDRLSSLSIAEGAQGRVLVHCFAGCTAAEVLGAIGLELKDIFPQRISADMSVAERSSLRRARKEANWTAALRLLSFEANIVEQAAVSVLASRPLTTNDQERLRMALTRIHDARQILC